MGRREEEKMRRVEALDGQSAAELEGKRQEVVVVALGTEELWRWTEPFLSPQEMVIPVEKLWVMVDEEGRLPRREIAPLEMAQSWELGSLTHAVARWTFEAMEKGQKKLLGEFFWAGTLGEEEKIVHVFLFLLEGVYQPSLWQKGVSAFSDVLGGVELHRMGFRPLNEVRGVAVEDGNVLALALQALLKEREGGTAVASQLARFYDQEERVYPYLMPGGLAEWRRERREVLRLEERAGLFYQYLGVLQALKEVVTGEAERWWIEREENWARERLGWLWEEFCKLPAEQQKDPFAGLEDWRWEPAKKEWGWLELASLFIGWHRLLSGEFWFLPEGRRELRFAYLGDVNPWLPQRIKLGDQVLERLYTGLVYADLGAREVEEVLFKVLAEVYRAAEARFLGKPFRPVWGMEAIDLELVAAVQQRLAGEVLVKSPETVFLAGCGTGFEMRFFRGLKVYAQDRVRRMVELASQRKEEFGVVELEVRQGDLEEGIVFEGEDLFDAAMMSFVVHYITAERLNFLLSEFKRVLKPGGVLAFNLRRPKESWGEDWQEKWRKLLGRVGFENIQIDCEEIKGVGVGYVVATA